MSVLRRVFCFKVVISLFTFFSFFGLHDVSGKVMYPVPGKKVPEKVHLVIYVDDHFTPQERFTVVKGLHEWQRATNGMVTMEEKSGWGSDQDFKEIPNVDENGLISCTKAVHSRRPESLDGLGSPRSHGRHPRGAE